MPGWWNYGETGTVLRADVIVNRDIVPEPVITFAGRQLRNNRFWNPGVGRTKEPYVFIRHCFRKIHLSPAPKISSLWFFGSQFYLSGSTNEIRNVYIWQLEKVEFQENFPHVSQKPQKMRVSFFLVGTTARVPKLLKGEVRKKLFSARGLRKFNLEIKKILNCSGCILRSKVDCLSAGVEKSARAKPAR